MSSAEPNLDALLGSAERAASHGTEKIYGVAPAIVIKIHDDEHQRHLMGAVQVWFPWLQPQDDPKLVAPWARCVSWAAGGGPDEPKRSGWVSTPQVGDEVLVGFEHGDITHPYVIGQLWNGQRKIPDPTPGGCGSAGAGGGAGAGQGGGGAGGAGGGQGAGQQGAGQAGGGAGGGQGAGRAGGGAGQQRASSRGRGAAADPFAPFQANLAGARASVARAEALSQALGETITGKPKEPPPLLKLRGLKTRCTAADWVAYHHPILFAEMEVRGPIREVIVDISPKRQPIAMFACWEPQAPGSWRIKRMVLGSAGDPHGPNPKCLNGPEHHRRSWWNSVPNWTSGKIKVPITKGSEFYTLALYPRYAGTFTIKVQGGGLYADQQDCITLTMEGAHPHPGD
ncbi:MAG: hypothetical protein KatS3mg102_0471 [Planctomycetota bacterium]|nr:MAG: hypothetical protein KatS3mg102_0471 [Planctomycetota bacterium]